MAVGVFSAADPFTVKELIVTGFNVAGNTQTAGKTVSSRALNGAIRNCVLLIAGDSNMSSVSLTNYTPSNSAVDNCNLYDGAVYAAADPLLGTSLGTLSAVDGYGCFAGRLADLLRASLFDRVVIMNIAQGGSKGVDWGTGVCNQRYIAAINRLAANGMTPTAQILGLGANDHGTSQASFAASLTALFATSTAKGVSAPWFVCKHSYAGSSADSNVQAAQVAAINHGASPPIWSGGDLDALAGVNRQTDGTHFSDTGMSGVASAIKSALALYGAPF